MSKLYIAGSLRNPVVLETAVKLKDAGHEVFVDWFGGGPGADDAWRDAEKALGYSMRDALRRPMAQNIMQFDSKWLAWADTIVIVAPAGKSAHMELIHELRAGKAGYVFFPEGDPERWDVMLAWATDIVYSVEELLRCLESNALLRLGGEWGRVNMEYLWGKNLADVWVAPPPTNQDPSF